MNDRLHKLATPGGLRKSDSALRRAGAYAHVARNTPHRADLAKSGLVGRVDPNGRTEFGTVDTSFGMLMVSHDRAGDSISVHGVNAQLADISSPHREALYAASEAFAEAENDAEQTTQRAVVAAIVDGVLHRHSWLGDQVKAAKQRERLD